MKTEIEVKFTRIDKDQIRKSLRTAGAVQQHPEFMMERKNFDYPDHRLEKIGAWVRVRKEFDKITLSYKQLQDRTLHGTKESCITVDSFDDTVRIIEALGLTQTSFQQSKRELWTLFDCEICIDEWPWIPPYIEIEGPDEETVRKTAHAIGFKMEDGLHGSVEIIYRHEYDVTDADVDNWPTILFSPVPEWLAKKRK